MSSQDFSQQQSLKIFQQNTQIYSNKNLQQNKSFDLKEISQNNSLDFNEISLNNSFNINNEQNFVNPNLPIQIITHLTKNKQGQQHLNSYHQLIDYFFQHADIKIKITNIDGDIINYLREIQNNLKNLNLNIKNVQIDQEQHLKKNLIYQINEQQDNNISQLDKMTILHSEIIENFYREAEKQQIKIMINYNKYQYKIETQNQMLDSAIRFYTYFKRAWDSYVILTVQLKSEFEANAKVKLLKRPRIHESFCKVLNLDQPIIISASQLNLAAFEVQSILKNQAMLIKKQANQIIVIGILYDQNIKIKDLQNKLEDFLNNTQNMKNVKETFDIDISMPKDIDEIDQSIRQLKEQVELIEIVVTNPVINVQNKGKYLVQAELQLWIEGDQPDYIIMQRLQAVKNKLNEIYHPNIIIKVTEQSKIKLWNQFLGQLFENQNNSKECITKQDNLKLSIELNGKQDDIFEKQQKINQYLEQFKCITLNCQCDLEVALVLKSKEYQFQRLFNQTLTEIASQFGQCLIQMIEVNQKKQLVVEVYYNQIQFEQNIIIQKINIFFETLEIQLIKIDFKEFLNYIEMKEIQFQDVFQVVVSTDNKQSETQIVGKKESLEDISNFLFQFEQSKKQDQTSETIDCDNQLIFNSIKQFQQKSTYKNISDDNVIISFPQENKIMIQASEKLIKQEKDKIIMQIQCLKSQIKNKICDFTDKEIKYIQKNLEPFLEQLKKNNQILISMSSQIQTQPLTQKSVACTLEYKNKSIQIIYADISTIKCDAIVNSCNNKMSFGDHLQLSGVAQSIFQMGGIQYQSFCLEYIKKYQELKLGVVATYKMPTQRQIKYILNVATPIYSQGDETDEDLKKIQENIKALFKEIKNLDIETITIPIFGGGACGYSFNQAARVVLNTTINELYSENNSIKTIYIAELTDVKIDSLSKILKLILKPPIREREIKYQWQWQDSEDFKDYDDEEINKQIDETYEQFQLTGQEQNVLLKFPYSKQPGTHLINFKNKTITDISLKTIKTLSSKMIVNSRKFFFDQEQVDDQLNEYLMIQELNDISQFTIFKKQHYVIFKEGQMYQMNLETQYKRKIQKQLYQKKKNSQNQQINYLVNKNYILNETQLGISKLVQQKNNYDQLTIQSFSVDINESIIKLIKQQLENEIKKLEIVIPNLPDAEIENIQNYIQQAALSTEGKFIQGNKIIIKYFIKKHKKIVQNIDSLINRGKYYPKEWIPQNQNYLKVSLSNNSDEYKKISNLFKKTDNGSIQEIFRIQNQSLWDNYINEKNKLIQIYQQQGIALKPIETERYLWHGVRDQNPQVIYSGLKEAFDQSYCDVGFWGAGIYFAENASYSRHYSYKLQQANNQGNGKCVFLCCLVTTGKVKICQQDKNIKRAPPGYDCVSGFSNEGNSNIFVLYSMDVRRAYPAYEIVFS
ncbi:unnamed protein product [Paramecium pentaurelia]|uniref:Poly [ADP-ribose] polymerase n=1 Tax=Paramecium pentaurelia TaxID=43138 RepID=A0A8S1XVT3_9CILI|nr:unnamed protein product [Paramecium pentaurelia]